MVTAQRERLYVVDILLAALDNVPSRGYEVAADNGERIEKQDATETIVLETWPTDVKLGIRDKTPGTRWFTLAGQSAMFGHRPGRLFRIIEHGVIEGGASPRIPYVCDRRDVIWALIEHTPTGRRFYIEVWHPGPLPTRKAPWQVPFVRAAHRYAASQGERRINRRSYPTACIGDFQKKRFFSTADRVVGQDIGNGIVHGEFFHGRSAFWGRITAEAVAMRSNHPGVRFSAAVTT